jgi:hypothetical protein
MTDAMQCGRIIVPTGVEDAISQLPLPTPKRKTNNNTTNHIPSHNHAKRQAHTHPIFSLTTKTQTPAPTTKKTRPTVRLAFQQFHMLAIEESSLTTRCTPVGSRSAENMVSVVPLSPREEKDGFCSRRVRRPLCQGVSGGC